MLAYTYNFQDMPSTVDIYADTDFAGCEETCRSTSGGAILVGHCLVKQRADTPRHCVCLRTGPGYTVADVRYGLEHAFHSA